MSRRRALILLAAAALFWLCRRAYFVGYFNDDAYYLIGAKSLLSGRYAEISAPGAPPLVNYLPGWPLLLAPVLALTGASLPAAQAFAVLLLVCGLFFFARVFERESGVEAADLALACSAVSPLLSSTAATLLSDGPMLFCAGAALAVLPRLWLRRDARAWIGFGLALGLAALVRPTGLALAAAVAAALLAEKRVAPAFGVFAAAALVLGAWLGRNALLSGAGWNYWSEASASARAGGVPFFANAWACVDALFARSLLRPPAPSAFWEAAAALGGLGLALAGGRGLKTPSGRTAAFFAAFFALPHLFWSKTAARYFIPLLPVSAWLLLRGAARLGPRTTRAAAALSVALSAAATAGVARASWSPSTPRNLPPRRAADWLVARARPGAVVAAEYDARWHLLTGLPCVHIPYDARTPQALERFLDGSRVSFVVVEDTSEGLKPAAGAYSVPDSSFLRGLLGAVKRARLAHSDGTGRVEVWFVRPLIW